MRDVMLYTQNQALFSQLRRRDAGNHSVVFFFSIYSIYYGVLFTLILCNNVLNLLRTYSSFYPRVCHQENEKRKAALDCKILVTILQTFFISHMIREPIRLIAETLLLVFLF